MSVIERELTYLVIPPEDLSSLVPGNLLRSFSLVSSSNTNFPGFTWRLEFPFPNTYRILLTGPDRPRPPHDNANPPPASAFHAFELVSLDTARCRAVFSFPYPTGTSLTTSGLNPSTHLQLRVFWKYQLFSEVWETTRGDASHNSTSRPVLRDLGSRSYALTEQGIIRHWHLERSHLHLGLGEKAAPIDLTGRNFTMHATDAALYDAYGTDPLYKHTPFLISTPKTGTAANRALTYGIFHATNSVATWDVGRQIDYPSGGWSKRFTQDWGGLEEWVMVGQGVEGVVRTFGEITGKPRLVGRDWLGYLASTVLLAEMRNAQEMLEKWPKWCTEWDIPCSAMHLSSGYTHDERTGAHLVFHLNKERYPNFKGMVELYHRAGIKIVPNVKPYLLTMHPDYKRLVDGDGLYFDPIRQGAARQNLGGNSESESGNGSWADFSAPETRKWWKEGVQGLIDLGVDGMWDDNNEFFTRDDAIMFKNEFNHKREVEHHTGHRVRTGLMGRITGNEMMNKVSHDTLQEAWPDRRTFVLTRSGNPAAFKYACSTWSGDNLTSWENLRGSQHIQLNSALSLMQNSGADVGGFAGPKPEPELFVRWVQLGVTHSRFCIHSDGSGGKLNTPWMYPEMLPIIRQHIKWRYFMLPFLNNLMWQSHLHATPPNAPLFYGPFAGDHILYGDILLEGFDSWLGVGQLLVAPQLFEGDRSRHVYFPQSSLDDDSVYFNLSGHLDYGPEELQTSNQHHRQEKRYRYYTAGEWEIVDTPIEHGALFAREGAVIPVGKDKATVTALSGLARTYPDGVDVELDVKEDGGGGEGQVGLDNWRGVMIFPSPTDLVEEEGEKQKIYKGEWIEDDGISADPATYTVRVQYWSERRGVVWVHIDVEEKGFKPLWAPNLHFILPALDQRVVIVGGQEIPRETRVVLGKEMTCHRVLLST